MFPDHASNTAKSSADNDNPSLGPSDGINREPVRIMLIGSAVGIDAIAKSLHHLGFAEIGDWSKPQAHPSSDKQMSILTKWIKH